MKIKRLLLLLALPLLVASCTSYKNVPYLQNPEAVNDFEETLPLYDAKRLVEHHGQYDRPEGCDSIQLDGTDSNQCGFDKYQYDHATDHAAILGE